MEKFSFLTEDDILGSLKDDQLYQIIRDNYNLIAEKESAAIDWMKSHLGNRYDVADCFPQILQWDATTDYILPIERTITIRCENVAYTPKYERDPQGNVLNYCWHLGFFFKALQASTNEEPDIDADTEFWKKEDPRIAVLKEYAVDITIMYLFKRVAPRKIPEFRIDLYNIAKEWLEKVQQGRLSPSLPYPVIPDQTTDSIQWGSNRRNEHYY